MVLEWIALAVIAVVVLFFIVIYNGLVGARNAIQNAWSQIDVQLKRRADLVPNLIETVKGYAAHEKSVFENVTKARTAFLNAKGVEDKAQATNMLTGALKTLFAVSENYPQLKANENFLQLQEELSGIESKIAFARQFYNDSVLELNNKIQQFPSSIAAGLFGFTVQPYFQIEETAREVPKVKF